MYLWDKIICSFIQDIGIKFLFRIFFWHLNKLETIWYVWGEDSKGDFKVCGILQIVFTNSSYISKIGKYIREVSQGKEKEKHILAYPLNTNMCQTFNESLGEAQSDECS